MEPELIFTCIRQHTFLDQKYILLLHPVKITLNQIGKEPKYVIELNLFNTISWQINQQNLLISFTVDWNGIEKQFHAQHEDLQKLRKAIANKIMFTTVHQMYKPMQQIGEGNLDEIYLCLDRVNSKPYEIKCLLKNQFEDSVERIHNEIKFLIKIKSDYVQKLHEIYSGENTVYLIQEYLEGLNLYELIQNVKLDRTQIKIIMKQLIQGVRDIHKHKIMHRDIKPTNIIFKNKDSIEGLKITDFHLAIAIDPNIDLRVCGTPGYAAPEKFNEVYNEKVDIFSIGCIFFKLVTSRDVFPGKTSHEIFRMNKKCNIDFKILQLYKLTENEMNLLKDLLELDPERRISAQAALQHPYFDFDDEFNEQQLEKKKSISAPTQVERIITTTLQIPINEAEKNIDEQQIDQESPHICAVPNFKVLKKDSFQPLQLRKNSKLKKSETQEYPQLKFHNAKFPARKSVLQTQI